LLQPLLNIKKSRLSRHCRSPASPNRKSERFGLKFNRFLEVSNLSRDIAGRLQGAGRSSLPRRDRRP
jgi:hypothetical protein